MNRYLVKLAVFLLMPALVADPALAISFIPAHAIPTRMLFTSQAINPRLIVGTGEVLPGGADESANVQRQASAIAPYVGKTVFITGASSGIGAALAREFARLGAKVVLTARRIDRLQAIERELTAQGFQVLAIACDVTKRSDILHAMQKAVQQFGPFDILIPNAGIIVGNQLERSFEEQRHDMFAVNVQGVKDAIEIALPYLKLTKGLVIYIGSSFGYGQAKPGIYYLYSITKAAARKIVSDYAAQAESSEVRFKEILPGLVQTELHLRAANGQFDPAQKYPAPRWLMKTPERAAQKIIAAIPSNKSRVILTWQARLFIWMSEVAPWLKAKAITLGAVMGENTAAPPPAEAASASAGSVPDLEKQEPGAAAPSRLRRDA